ncbi:hypothetical protein GYMLUDRAFT_51427 [Collybiopsis luxurians FD-317 M1]|uniref:Uncharacterized protein n=1 Tax=Collybiopsis luxurians FD-317 M1 TaxID=944289 RepID=A0A0D0BKL8_9AGAR|nr:hypothetical protein GYMLUDRAFT_51427 [Collybiopsis luxurians FD-317 M1]
MTPFQIPSQNPYPFPSLMPSSFLHPPQHAPRLLVTELQPLAVYDPRDDHPWPVVVMAIYKTPLIRTSGWVEDEGDSTSISGNR